MRWTNQQIWILAGLLGLIACVSSDAGSHSQAAPEPYDLELPEAFPAVPIPDDNPLTEAGIALGRHLFFDPQLSKDQSLSCASCHKPEFAFADTVAVSEGVHPDRPGRRNAPSLANVAYQHKLFMEGGVPSIELAVIAPMSEASEMDVDMALAIERLKANEEYVALAESAYGQEIDMRVITWALASYQRTLISGNSAFDRYKAGETNVISQSAVRGWQHFQRLGCSACHSGHLFSNQSYFNIGLSDSYTDPGLGRLTDKPEDEGKFKVPSLRNVALTAPYMHDGSLATLDEVIDHFASGGSAHPNKSMMIRGFEISDQEKAELIAFLESLSDSAFISQHSQVSL